MTNKSDEQCFSNESSRVFTEEQLCNSYTIQRLSILSKVNPINTNDRAEVIGAFGSSLVYLVEAFDNKQIDFQSKADEDAFFLMMLTAFEITTQMQPVSAIRH